MFTLVFSNVVWVVNRQGALPWLADILGVIYCALCEGRVGPVATRRSNFKFIIISAPPSVRSLSRYAILGPVRRKKCKHWCWPNKSGEAIWTLGTFEIWTELQNCRNFNNPNNFQIPLASCYEVTFGCPLDYEVGQRFRREIAPPIVARMDWSVNKHMPRGVVPALWLRE